MPEYPILPARHLTGAVRLIYPAPPRLVTMESPALEIMTDLRHIHIAEIQPHATMESANVYMMQRGVRSLFVLNDDYLLQGVITASDILGEKPLRFIQERRVKHSEILVSDIMTPLDCLEAIPFEEVQHAKVGHVVASLREAGRQHTLVMEEDVEGGLLICGIFSLTQIEKQLGIAIPLTEIAKTFAEIEATLTH
ncbi:CBS domain-containing protein [Nitrosomonas communis]|uniref:CBS domain-containing protein n=1 Tax=Nitrosomonas communis TaxID=44574 RepID=UPI0026E996DC|nr:CBS domain-containing protein [Nitrosomonas communis]MCO6428062.1 CBS domain-containing protein [Nitrosomonas communis]